MSDIKVEDRVKLAQLPKGYWFDCVTGNSIEKFLIHCFHQGKFPPEFQLFTLRKIVDESKPWTEWSIHDEKTGALTSTTHEVADRSTPSQVTFKELDKDHGVWNDILAVSTDETVVLNTKYMTPEEFARDYSHIRSNFNGINEYSMDTFVLLYPLLEYPRHGGYSKDSVDEQRTRKMQTIVENFVDPSFMDSCSKKWKIVHNVYYPWA